MKVLLAPVGSTGDVQPMLALARALADAGHAVNFACPPNFESAVREAELPFTAIGRDVQAWLAELQGERISPWRLLRVLREFFEEEIRQQSLVFEELVSTDIDVVLQAGMSAAAAPYCELHDVPLVQVHYTPAMLPSDEHGPILLPFAGKGKWTNRVLWAINDWQFFRLVCRPLNDVRRSMGLPSLPGLASFSAPFGLALWDEALAGFPGDYAATRRRTGYRTEMSAPLGHIALSPRDVSPDRDLLEWLESGSPPVYLGFGSMPDAEPSSTLAMFSEVCERLGLRGVHCSGWSGTQGVSSPRVRTIERAPHSWLFPKCQALVHHGGAGTVATAARAGKPQVVIPHGVDQYDWANRVHVAGVAPAGIPRTKLTADKLERALAWALRAGPRRRAIEVAQDLRRRPPPMAATLAWLEARFGR